MTEDCTCNYRHSTDGCTEWSCMYHGQENREQSMKLRDACPVHKKDK